MCVCEYIYIICFIVSMSRRVYFYVNKFSDAFMIFFSLFFLSFFFILLRRRAMKEEREREREERAMREERDREL